MDLNKNKMAKQIQIDLQEDIIYYTQDIIDQVKDEKEVIETPILKIWIDLETREIEHIEGWCSETMSFEEVYLRDKLPQVQFLTYLLQTI
jgi:hypothetical protein